MKRDLHRPARDRGRPELPEAMPSPQPDHPDLRPSHEAIAALAYEFYQLRGYAAGGELEDWLRAEKEFLGRSAGHADRPTEEPEPQATPVAAKAVRRSVAGTRGSRDRRRR